VTIISACSLVGVSVLPLMGKAFYAKLLTVMVGLAVGSLSGSSVFHLIPQVIARYTYTLERMGFFCVFPVGCMHNLTQVSTDPGVL
jgi:hypothetical protein